MLLPRIHYAWYSTTRTKFEEVFGILYVMMWWILLMQKNFKTWIIFIIQLTSGIVIITTKNNVFHLAWAEGSTYFCLRHWTHIFVDSLLQKGTYENCICVYFIFSFSKTYDWWLFHAKIGCLKRAMSAKQVKWIEAAYIVYVVAVYTMK